MIVEWNGDKLVVDGVALSALEDDHRDRGWGSYIMGYAPP